MAEAQIFSLIYSGNAQALTRLVQADPQALLARDDTFGATPLHWAADAGRDDLCAILLKNNAQINARNSALQTPLHIAAGRGYPQVVKLLLDWGANPFMLDKQHYTAKDYAELAEQAEIHTLLQQYEQTYAESLCGDSLPSSAMLLESVHPLIMSCGWGSPHPGKSVENRPLRIAGKQFRHGIGTHANSSLLLATQGKMGYLFAIVGLDDEVAGQSKASVVFSVLSNNTVIWQSKVLRPGMYECVDLDVAESYLLELRVTDAGDGIASDHADWGGAYLLPIDSQQKFKLRALPAVSENFTPHETDDIFTAAANGDLPRVQEMVHANPDIISASDADFGGTLLHWAMRTDMTAVTELLIKEGADVNAHNLAGQTPLHIAAGMGYEAQVRCLLKAGAKPGELDNLFLSAADYAARFDHANLVKVLEQTVTEDDEDTAVQEADESASLTPVFIDPASYTSKQAQAPEAPEILPAYRPWDTMSANEKAAAIVKIAKKQMETKKHLRYEFGGREENGVLDCSGFVDGVLREALHIYVGNTRAIMHARYFTHIPFDQRQPGDLLNCVNPPHSRRYEGHVMIYVGNDEVIDMCSTVGHISQHAVPLATMRKYSVLRIL